MCQEFCHLMRPHPWERNSTTNLVFILLDFSDKKRGTIQSSETKEANTNEKL